MGHSATTCSEIRGWVSAHVAGGLGVTEWALLEVHLAQCVACRQELQQLQESKNPPRQIMQSLFGCRPAVPLAHAGIRPGARSGVWLARSSRWARHLGAGCIAGVRSLPRVAVAVPISWFLRRVGDVIGWVGLGLRAYRSVRLWRPRTAIGLRSPSRTDVMTTLVRVGTGFVALALMGTFMCFRPLARPAHDIPVVSSPSTTAIPAAAPPVDLLVPALDVPIRPRPVGGIRSSTGVRTTSPGQPKKQDEIPLPVRIPAGGASSSPPAPDNPPTNQGAAIPQKGSSEQDAAIDWLLKDERRN
jgi:hypothetical protein